jgi:RES domain-containing protein
LHGGRYNFPATAGVLYASLDKATAVAEVIGGLRARGIDPAAYGPDDWWAYELEVDLGSVLDLTDEGVLEQLSLSAASLLTSEVTVTREMGKQAADARCEAIVAPSAARHAGKNVVIFLSAAIKVPDVKSSAAVDFSRIQT